MSWQDQIEARTRAQRTYDQAHTTRLSIKLNVRTDADVIAWIRRQRSMSMQGAIKSLIRAEIARAAGQDVGQGTAGRG